MPKNVAALSSDTQVKTDQVRPKHTIGIDLGDRTTHFCVVNTDGTIAEEGSFRTDAANFEKLISRSVFHEWQWKSECNRDGLAIS
jgi:hypothetical protein